MRAVDEHRGCAGDEGRIDVFLAERHVRAVLSIEEEWKAPLVTNAQNGEGGEPARIRDDAAHLDAAADELLADEAPEMIVAHAGEESGMQPEPRGTDRRVRWAAPHVLGEGSHVLEPTADLLAVEVHGGPSDRDQVERTAADRFRHGWSRCCFYLCNSYSIT